MTFDDMQLCPHAHGELKVIPATCLKLRDVNRICLDAGCRGLDPTAPDDGLPVEKVGMKFGVLRTKHLHVEKKGSEMGENGASLNVKKKSVKRDKRTRKCSVCEKPIRPNLTGLCHDCFNRRGREGEINAPAPPAPPAPHKERSTVIETVTSTSKPAEKIARVTLLAITPDAERLIEQAGRTCYQSLGKIDDMSHEKFIQMLIKSGHESVLEHASATFRFRGSRAFTHQMVRHRLCSFSQQSQRYVSEDKFEFVMPKSLEKGSEAEFIYKSEMANIQRAYCNLIELGVKREDARFVLPNACLSEIVISANFRQWRWIFKKRCNPKAQWEIRELCFRALRILGEKAPSVFGDFSC